MEVVVLHLPGNLHLLFADEGQQQLSAEPLAQCIDAFVEHEHPWIMCQHNQPVLRWTLHQSCLWRVRAAPRQSSSLLGFGLGLHRPFAYAQLQAVGRSLVMADEVHHRSHLAAAIQRQPVRHVQRYFLVLCIDDGDVQFISQPHCLDDTLVGHQLHVLSDSLLLRGPEVLLMSEHLLVGISGIEAVGTQLFAQLSQFVQVFLPSIHLLAPDSAIHHHKLTERNHPFQLCPHYAKPFQWSKNQNYRHFL